MHKGLYNDDYVIFHSYGKHHMIVFAEIYKSLGVNFQVFFDKDNEQNASHLIANQKLITYNHYMFDDKIENELGFNGDKTNAVQFISFLETIDYDLREYLINN